jgi:MFS family permease
MLFVDSDWPASLFGHRPFLFYFLARGFSRFAMAVGVVAVGWQIYALTNSAFYLGLAGLVQFLPTAILVFASGHVADRYDRRRVIRVCQLVESLTASLLAWGSFNGHLSVTLILISVAVIGAASAFEGPAVAALLPGAVPEGQLQRGTALATSAVQFAIVSGPALGGLAYAASPVLPYAIMTAFWLFASALNGAIHLDRPVQAKEAPSFKALFAGARFVRENPVILGITSLDLFAVLLGGATSLMPIYARDILHTGPWGLGVLRASPAVGALLMTALLSRCTIKHQAGKRMFQAVIVFGLATLVFAFSRVIWISILALAVAGAADTISVVIRVSLVQLATPDAMRGRVSAINFLFINASNQLGEFESGMAAAAFGTVPAAALGAVGTIAIAFIWMKLFPALRQLETLE